jgi:iron(III)-salmochelin esterase
LPLFHKLGAGDLGSPKEAVLSGRRFLSVAITVMIAAIALSGCYGPEESTSKPRLTPLASRETLPAETSHERKPPPSLDLKIDSDKPDRVRGKVSSLPRASVSREPMVEKLTGYKTKGEYVTINSVNFPDPVVAVTLPSDYEKHPRKRYPLVIAFGGAGECARPPREGALAWMHYYKTDEAVRALDRNRLDARDFRGLVSVAHLKAFNRRLKQQPYEGLILACPYSPPLPFAGGRELPEYEAYIIDELILALKKRYRVDPGRIGVDGVSMGGARSMYYGFKYPEIFASIGSLQGAFGSFLETYADLVHAKRHTLKKRSIQLVTSDRDPLAPSVEKLHRLLLQNGITHRYQVLTGPHDYIFNQGPGSIAILMFHNEALTSGSVGPAR